MCLKLTIATIVMVATSMCVGMGGASTGINHISCNNKVQELLA